MNKEGGFDMHQHNNRIESIHEGPTDTKYNCDMHHASPTNPCVLF